MERKPIYSNKKLHDSVVKRIKEKDDKLSESTDKLKKLLSDNSFKTIEDVKAILQGGN